MLDVSSGVPLPHIVVQADLNNSCYFRNRPSFDQDGWPGHGSHTVRPYLSQGENQSVFGNTVLYRIPEGGFIYMSVLQSDNPRVNEDCDAYPKRRRTWLWTRVSPTGPGILLCLFLILRQRMMYGGPKR